MQNNNPWAILFQTNSLPSAVQAPSRPLAAYVAVWRCSCRKRSKPEVKSARWVPNAVQAAANVRFRVRTNWSTKASTASVEGSADEGAESACVEAGSAVAGVLFTSAGVAGVIGVVGVVGADFVVSSCAQRATMACM